MLDAVSVTVSWFVQHGNGTLPPAIENTSVLPTWSSQANITQPHGCLQVLYEDIGSSRYVCPYMARINPGVVSVLSGSCCFLESSFGLHLLPLGLHMETECQIIIKSNLISYYQKPYAIIKICDQISNSMSILLLVLRQTSIILVFVIYIEASLPLSLAGIF